VISGTCSHPQGYRKNSLISETLPFHQIGGFLSTKSAGKWDILALFFGMLSSGCFFYTVRSILMQKEIDLDTILNLILVLAQV
jgi:hypothetical protein